MFGSRRYRYYTEEQLLAAVNEYKPGFPLRKTVEKHGIPFRTIKDRAGGTHKKTAGGLTIFSDSQENSLIKLIQVCGKKGVVHYQQWISV